jgi:hypothetical protein
VAPQPVSPQRNALLMSSRRLRRRRTLASSVFALVADLSLRAVNGTALSRFWRQEMCRRLRDPWGGPGGLGSPP